MTEPVSTLGFPEEDIEFARHVGDLVQTAPVAGFVEAAVEAMLRETYALAVISRRAAIAAVDAKDVWYFFRDGSVVPRAGEST